MSDKPVSSFTTLLLAIPLSAIPLMAVFGVPEFASLSASTDPSVPDIMRRPSQSLADENDSPGASTEGFRNRAADLLASTGSPPPSQYDSTPETRWDLASAETTSVAATDPAAPSSVAPRPMQTAAVQQQLPIAAPSATASGLTWRAATHRLDELGITNYRIERGKAADDFLFVCLFSPGADSRIIQRFEAEASDPLLAVEDVLGQVESWLQARYSEERSWIR